jgi:hypothetical protein
MDKFYLKLDNNDLNKVLFLQKKDFIYKRLNNYNIEHNLFEIK